MLWIRVCVFWALVALSAPALSKPWRLLALYLESCWRVDFLGIKISMHSEWLSVSDFVGIMLRWFAD